MISLSILERKTLQKIKDKIEKLLRLSLSNSPHEATLAAQRAIELMDKHSITRADLDKESIVIKEIEINYARVPGWVRKLYKNIAIINGCYMLWQDGYKDGSDFGKKAKIILAGINSDIENIDYYVDILKNEITKKAEIFKQDTTSEREMIKSYRMGLVQGVYNVLYKASQTFNKNIKNYALVSVDTRAEEAKSFYNEHFDVRTLPTLFKINAYYSKGIDDAKSISVSRPISEEKKDDKLLLGNN